MTMQEARDLQADLTKLLLALHVAAQPQASTTVDELEINGGDF